MIGDLMEYKKEYLKQLVNDKNSTERPNIFYKYRPFDEYTFDMLENSYLYLSPANTLDDPSECTVDINMKDLVEINNDHLTRRCLSGILDTIKPYTSVETFEELQSRVFSCCNSYGKFRMNLLMDNILDIQSQMNGINVAEFVNLIRVTTKALENPDVKKQFEDMVMIAVEAREKMGICSLATTFDNIRLWNEYSNNQTGYCVEYDFKEYDKEKYELLPVLYEDNRQNNIAEVLVNDFLLQIIKKMSNDTITTDSYKYLSIFITKDTVWKYQNEWRLIGEAKDRAEGVIIKKIILGENVSVDNEEKMQEFCNKREIPLFKYCHNTLIKYN